MKADIRSKNVYNIDEWWDVFARPKLASKRLVCWRCLRGVYWRPDLAVTAVERERPDLAATAVERKRPSLAITAVKHKRLFLAVTVMTRLTLILHNEALVHNRECHPGGHLWLYKTGPLPVHQFPATPSEIEHAYTESAYHLSSYQLQCTISVQI